MISNEATIGAFLDVLANQLDRPVTDMTGLSGRYDTYWYQLVQTYCYQLVGVNFLAFQLFLCHLFSRPF